MEERYIKKDLLLYTVLVMLVAAILVGIYWYDHSSGQFGQFATYLYGILVRQ